MAFNANFRLLAPAAEISATQPNHIPRASDIICAPRSRTLLRFQKTNPRKDSRNRTNGIIPPGKRRKQLKNDNESKKSVLAMLLGENMPRENSEAKAQTPQRICESIDDTFAYIKKVTRDCVSQLRTHGPWVVPPCAITAAAAINAQRQREGLVLLTAEELLKLCERPLIFVWDPQMIFPDIDIMCPSCGLPACRSNWCRPRLLHTLSGYTFYITLRYGCYSCGSNCKRKSQASRSMKFFLADSPDVRASLPKHISSAWKFIDSGRHICDARIVDLVRALATKTSWSAIAFTINEMNRGAWERQVEMPYLDLCHTFQVSAPTKSKSLPNELRLSDEYIKKLYMVDFENRKRNVLADLANHKGDDILRLDWTEGAATRGGGKYLLNILDGCGYILTSELTTTSKPWAAKRLIENLALRGTDPKVAYVDEECCGAWRNVLQSVWPSIHVRLDGMHAIMRLTRTTTSTQHPCHGKFCASLSDAIYKLDENVMQRLKQAWAREHGDTILPDSIIRKFIPRHIREPCKIVVIIESILQDMQTRTISAGPLLTDATQSEWLKLRTHISSGCLSDAPGMDMNILTTGVTIAGETFHEVRSLRGTSAVEGLHAHQKQWLGTFAHHAADVGHALLQDGAELWNRSKRARLIERNNAPQHGAGVFNDLQQNCHL